MNGKECYAVVLETVDGERRVTCGRDEFIWDAAARGGIALPAICHQGRCLTCAGRLLSGEVDQSKSNQYLAQDKQAGFVLLCTAQPRSDVRILTDQQWSMREHRRKLGLPAPYS
jgi:ferredoxin